MIVAERKPIEEIKGFLAVRYQMSEVRYQISDIRFSVFCPLSSVLCPLSSVLCTLYSVLCTLASVLRLSEGSSALSSLPKGSSGPELTAEGL